MPVSAPTASSLSVARSFADAYARGDAAAVASLLAPDVHEREITPSAIVDQRGRDAVVAEATDFLRAHGRPEVVGHTVEPLGDLVRWSTRWRVTQQARALLVEWHAFLTVEDGRITKLDVVCSGVLPDDAF